MAREVSTDFLRIDLTDGKTRKVISACQSDTIQRTLHFLVVNAGRPLDLTNLFYAEIIVKRTDGTYLDNACVIDGNDIQYTLKSTDVAVIGENEAHLLLSFKDGTVKETPTFYLNVFSTFYNAAAIQSQSEYTALVNKVLDAQEAANDALESKNAAEAAAADAADSADEAGTYVETVSLYTSEAGSHASTAENYASEAGSYLASASNVASEVEAVSEYMSTTSEYLESASEYASEAGSYAAQTGDYIASASEYASAAASEADKGSGYITSLSTTGSEYISSLSSMASEYASTEAGYLSSTSEYASAAASEASVANSCAVAAEAAMSGKVSKAGDTMTGILTEKNSAPVVWLEQMDGDDLNAKYQWNVSTDGDMYLHNSLLNKNIVKATKAGVHTFNGSANDNVLKTGDTMSGNLTIQRANGNVTWKDMDGNTLRRQIWEGFANSAGSFYIYDSTNNKGIISAPLSGTTIFHGQAESVQGFSRTNSNCGISVIANSKINNLDAGILEFRMNSQYAIQIGIQWSDQNTLWHRTQTQGTWNSWIGE